MERVRELSNAPLILAAYGEPNGIVETGLEVGAATSLVLPQPAETLLFAIRKAAMGSGHRAGKVVTVFSPKGGSGKTVVATNLAVAAARSGLRTVLVDLDLQFGDSALTMAVARARPSPTSQRRRATWTSRSCARSSARTRARARHPPGSEAARRG